MVIEIDDLNDDCLIHMFSFLPIIDRFKLQSVCLRWRLLLPESWTKTKAIILERDFWGITAVRRDKAIINRMDFIKILESCGQYLIHIDLSMRDLETSQDFSVKSSKNNFIAIKELCPNVKSIKMDEPCTLSAIEYLAVNFENLTHIEINLGNHTKDDTDTVLSLLFKNNKFLKCVSLKHCGLLNDCLLNLNADTLEEFHIIETQIQDTRQFCIALQKLKKVHTLTLMNTVEKSVKLTSINSVLQATCKSAANIKCLKLKYFQRHKNEDLDYSFIQYFKNLEKLCIEGCLIANDSFLEIIGANCKKLKCIQMIDTSSVSNLGMCSIVKLPQLQHLYLRFVHQVTDEILSDIPSLKTLDIDWCHNIRTDGLVKLLNTSKSMKLLKCMSCPELDCEDLISRTKDSKTEYLSVVINNSYVPRDEPALIEDIHTLYKCGHHIIRKIKQSCYSCSNFPDPKCKICRNVIEEYYKE